MDCVYDVFFDETFNLSKEKIPQKGKSFAKYTLDNDILKVTYYYEEWVKLYKEKILKEDKPFPFLTSFTSKDKDFEN